MVTPVSPHCWQTSKQYWPRSDCLITLLLIQTSWYRSNFPLSQQCRPWLFFLKKTKQPKHLKTLWQLQTYNQLISNKRYKLASVPIKDSDQPAHPCSLIRVLDWRSMDCQGSKIFQAKIEGSDWTANAQTDVNLRWSHMTTCSLCGIPAQIRSIINHVSFNFHNLLC